MRWGMMGLCDHKSGGASAARGALALALRLEWNVKSEVDRLTNSG